MTIPTLPTTLSLSPVEFFLAGNTRRHVSPFNQIEQVVEMGSGARWIATLTVEPLLSNSAEAAELDAMINGLLGSARPIWLNPPRRRTPRGALGGTPLVAGADQAGETLITDGWTPSTSGVLLPGDYFGVSDRIYQITAAADSDGGGAATLAFVPPLRAPPADNAPIVTSLPRAPFRLSDDAGARSTDQGLVQSRVLTLIEALEYTGA